MTHTYYQRHREHLLEYARQYHQAHKEHIQAYKQQYALTHKEQRQESGKRYYQAHKVEQKERRENIKMEALTYYGSGKLACVECGESRLPCLSIDHLNGGGSQHRKECGIRGNGIYRWLIQQGFPLGYQTLCMNCQFIKKFEWGEVK